MDIFYRETYRRFIAKADKDPKKGSIQFIYRNTPQEVAKKYHPNDVDKKLTGALTLVMSLQILENENAFCVGGWRRLMRNIGRICPLIVILNL